MTTSLHEDERCVRTQVILIREMESVEQSYSLLFTSMMRPPLALPTGLTRAAGETTTKKSSL